MYPIDDQISEELWTEIMIDEADRIYWQFPNRGVKRTVDAQ
jgi:hypothetical protein